MAKSKQSPIGKGIAQLLGEDALKKKAPKKAAVKASVLDNEYPVMINIPLEHIKLDPNNPRKHIDDEKLDELIDSVREKGILQPIIVRPNGDEGFIIIAGERRYRAAAAVATGYKTRNSIPAVVREDISEDQVRDLQLIENIQRADMHPIEEAHAFLELVENGNTPDEIGAKVGKSVYYIRQRLKLNDLEMAWVEAYKAGKVRHKDALQLATLGKEAQMDLLDNYDQEEEFILEDWDITRCQTRLSEAAFSLSENYEGLPKCTQCQFNTGVNSLFPDQDPAAYCRNRKCYELKEAYSFDMNLDKVKEDPEVILLSASYWIDKTEQESWSIAGLEVYSARDFVEIEEPDIDEYDLDDEDDGPENKIEYEKALQEYRDLIVKAETVRAFKMNGNNKGEIVFGTLSKKSAPIGLSEREVSATDDTQAEIDRINDKEKRAKELDGEKVWTKIRELLDKPATLKQLISDEPLNGSEIPMLKKAIHDKISYNHQSWTKKIAGNGNNNDIRSMYRALILDALVDSYGSHLAKNSDNAIAYKYIKEILPKEVAVIELEQQELAEKRQERVNKRIADLKKKEA